MNLAAIKLPARLKRLVALILIMGFGVAVVLYVTATPGSGRSAGYDPADSKRDMREMEIYGGTANVLASDFRHRFTALWHGRNLAFTVAFLTLTLALAVLFFGTPLPADVVHLPKDRRSGNGTDG